MLHMNIFEKRLTIPIIKLLRGEGKDEETHVYALPQYATRVKRSKGQVYRILIYLDEKARVLQTFGLSTNGEYRLVEGDKRALQESYVRLQDIRYVVVYEGWQGLKKSKIFQYYLPNAEIVKGSGYNFGNTVLQINQSAIIDTEVARKVDKIAEYCKDYVSRISFREKETQTE